MVERNPHGSVGQVPRCRKCSCGAYPGAYLGNRLRAGRVYAVVSDQVSDEALELFVDRQMAELMVENCDRDEPDRVGELYVEPVELETSVN